MEKIKIPKDMDDAKALGTVLSKYKDTYYSEVLVAYFATYVLYPWRKCMHFLDKYISDLFLILNVFKAETLTLTSAVTDLLLNEISILPLYVNHH